MPSGPVEKNPVEYFTYKNEECVRFTTTGKHKFSVIVDQSAWDGYLCDHVWSVSVDKKSGRASVKTSIENQTVFYGALSLNMKRMKLITGVPPLTILIMIH